MQPVDWALRQSQLSGAKQLLLVGLAWVSDDDGVTIKGQKTLGERLGHDERWVRQHLKGLADEGLLSRFRRHRANGSRTSDLIVLNMPRSVPLDLSNYSGVIGDREEGDVDPTGGNPPVAPTGGNVSDLPAGSSGPTGGNPPGHTDNQLEQPVDEPRAGAREQPGQIDLQGNTTPSVAKKTKTHKVDGQDVSAAECEFAEQVLLAFNEIFATGFTSQGWKDKITRRHRERPRATVEHHRAILKQLSTEDWWRERGPTPEIAYGNPEQFERCIAKVDWKAKSASVKKKSYRDEQGWGEGAVKYTAEEQAAMRAEARRELEEERKGQA